MKLLLDTHIAIWATLEPEALTEAERWRMAGADTALVLSAVAVWELRLKWQSFHISGRRKGPIEPAAIVAFAPSGLKGCRLAGICSGRRRSDRYAAV